MFLNGLREEQYEKVNYYQVEIEKIKKNIKHLENYLKLFEWFGDTITKRDLVPSNILYRKTDNKFFLIDWDNVQYLKNKDECYNFYKEQLCDHRWQDTFKMNRKEVGGHQREF